MIMKVTHIFDNVYVVNFDEVWCPFDADFMDVNEPDEFVIVCQNVPKRR